MGRVVFKENGTYDLFLSNKELDEFGNMYQNLIEKEMTFEEYCKMRLILEGKSFHNPVKCEE